ncbi:MAG TPA: hypothetical protein VMW69_07380, partial [Spirochaetia bacterium]|nr:hypothetical protein [Spirochaetia bacterium]
MRIRRFFTSAVVGVMISLLVLQSILAAPLPFAVDRPERTNDRGLSNFAQVEGAPRSRLDSQSGIHLIGTLTHEAAQNRQSSERALEGAFGSALDPIEAGYPALALDPVRAADPANSSSAAKTEPVGTGST